MELDAGEAARWSAFRNPAQPAVTPVSGWMVVYTENATGDQVDLFGLP